MTTIVRRRRLGMTSVRGIQDASTTGIRYANNYDGLPHDDVYIRWGCTSNVPNREAQIINHASGIHRVADKSGFRRLLNRHDLCPPTFFRAENVPGEFVDSGMVTRPSTHAQGRHLYVSYTYRDLVDNLRRAGAGAYTGLLIRKSAEYRVFVLQGRVVWVAQKTPGNPDEVAWNVARGGRFDNVRWDSWLPAVLTNAIDSWHLTGLHFAGIDVMVDQDGKAYCLEANSAPSQTSPYRQGCVAKAFDWMIENNELGLQIENLSEEHRNSQGWRGCIHPGVWS